MIHIIRVECLAGAAVEGAGCGEGRGASGAWWSWRAGGRDGAHWREEEAERTGAKRVLKSPNPGRELVFLTAV
jgi:hypothetical protein